MGVCANGHANAADARFCVICGLVVLPPQAAGSAIPEGLSGPGQAGGFVPGPSMPRAKQRKGWLIPVVIVGALAVVGILVVATGVLSGAKTTTVNVTMTIFGTDGCSIGLGYLDVPGSLVVLTADGQLAGSTVLSEYGNETYDGCEFDAAIPDVTTKASTYNLAIGSRGEISSSNAELKGNAWLFEATLGD
jgi:hypothetical protein